MAKKKAPQLLLMLLTCADTRQQQLWQRACRRWIDVVAYGQEESSTTLTYAPYMCRYTPTAAVAKSMPQVDGGLCNGTIEEEPAPAQQVHRMMGLNDSFLC